MSSHVARDDALAALSARRELGDDFEPAVVDAFVERVERGIDARIDARLAEAKRERGTDMTTVMVAVGSLGCAIPLTAITASLVGVAGVLVVWVAILAINLAHARSH